MRDRGARSEFLEQIEVVDARVPRVADCEEIHHVLALHAIDALHFPGDRAALCDGVALDGTQFVQLPRQRMECRGH